MTHSSHDPDHGRRAVSEENLAEIRRGLNMANPPDPVVVRAEAAMLEKLEGGPAGPRYRQYLKLIGPGYLQSAMTLGGGTAAASLYAGALFGYQLLWVAPLAMFLGIVMLSAISHQTLSTGIRPLQAMATYAGKPLAQGFAFTALLASVIWHFPQYNLAANSIVDIGIVLSVEGIPVLGASAVVLVWAVLLTSMYGKSPRLVRVYERVLKYMVWGIVFCFGWVVVRTETDWGAVLAGFVPSLPANVGGTSSLDLVVAGLAAAVGINMLFLYPYSLLARGWGRAHRGLARFDLLTGMLIPYALATTLMVIATANTMHGGDASGLAKTAAIGEAGRVLGETIGPVSGRLIFDLGVLGMALSTITLHMLTCGFIAMEWLGCDFGSRKHRLATLAPTPAFLAPLIWGDIAVWLAVPTTIACGFFLPVAYLAYLKLQRSHAYLGADRPSGLKGTLWFIGMLLATAVMVAFLAFYLYRKFAS